MPLSLGSYENFEEAQKKMQDKREEFMLAAENEVLWIGDDIV